MPDLYELLVKDLAPIALAAGGIVVAYEGLQTWRRQLQGGVEYDLARRVLVTVYKMREGFSMVRGAEMRLAEIEPRLDEASASLDPAVRQHISLERAYRERWERFFSLISDLQADLLEAEAVWGPELPNMFKGLQDLQFELWKEITYDLRRQDPRRRAVAELDEQRELRHLQFIYKTSDDDEFATKLKAAMRPIEDYLRPHLRKRG